MEITAGFDEALLCWEAGNSSEALRLWRAAADKGDHAAQLQVGLCCELGLGSDVDYASAANYYAMSASAGNPEAQFSLGTMCRDGRGVPQDYARAMELFNVSAARGVVKSHTALGSMFNAGMGVPRDGSEASRWYRIAAHRGDRDAQFMLGVLYLSGAGVPQNDAVAADWFRQAAECGDVEAQFNLGLLYFRGEGVPRDIVTSHKWLNLSKVGGYERATSLLATVALEMSYDEITCAIAMAQEFSARSHYAEKSGPDDSERQRLTSALGSISAEVETILETELGSSLFGVLHSVTRAFLLKAEAEFGSRRDGSELSAAFLLAKAFENEFNLRIRNSIARRLIARGYNEYPAGGDRKFIRDGRLNERLTPGQVIYLIQHDSLLQRLLREEGLSPGDIIRVCDGVIALRNQLVHGDFTHQGAALLRERLLERSDNAFAVLVSATELEHNVSNP